MRFDGIVIFFTHCRKINNQSTCGCTCGCTCYL